MRALSASKLAGAPAAARKVAECYPATNCVRCDPALPVNTEALRRACISFYALSDQRFAPIPRVKGLETINLIKT